MKQIRISFLGFKTSFDLKVWICARIYSQAHLHISVFAIYLCRSVCASNIVFMLTRRFVAFIEYQILGWSDFEFCTSPPQNKLLKKTEFANLFQLPLKLKIREKHYFLLNFLNSIWR